MRNKKFYKKYKDLNFECINLTSDNEYGTHVFYQGTYKGKGFDLSFYTDDENIIDILDLLVFNLEVKSY